MTTWAAVGFIVVGLGLLALGGDWLVRGATSVARLAGLTPAVIGLTIVAMGTSLPELVVSVIASIQNKPDLSVGNVVGSNIFNITAILGVTAILAPLAIRGNVVKIEAPVMLAAAAATILIGWDGLIGRGEAAAFIVAMVAFVVFSVRLARTEVSAEEQRELTEEVEGRELPRRVREIGIAAAATLGGIGLLVVGGKWLVDGASRLAELAGWSERVIGLTIVAAGTSAPEVATSIAAALKKQSDIAVANLIGSNIFNCLGILGLAGAVLPLQVSPAMVASDMWWMMGTSILVFGLLALRRVLGRAEGTILVAVYAVYLWRLL